MKTAKEQNGKRKLNLEKFNIARLTNANTIKGGGDWTDIDQNPDRDDDKN